MALQQLKSDSSTESRSELSIDDITMLARDLVTYILKQYKITWKQDYYSPRERNAIFSPKIGRVIMYKMLSLDRSFRTLCNQLFPNGVWKSSAIVFLACRLFRDRPFAELIVFCSFACYICVFCSRKGHAEAVNDLIMLIVYAFNCGLKKPFMEAGGWPAFCIFIDELNRCRRIADGA